jgi:thiol-disulfide isomerase/thioredoxin
LSQRIGGKWIAEVRSTRKSRFYFVLSLLSVAVLVFAIRSEISFSNANTGKGSPVLPPASDLGISAKAPIDLGIPEMGSPKILDIAKLAGNRPIVVNFFASWCPLCIAELKAFAKVSALYRGRVLFIGIDTNDQNVALAKRYLQQAGISYPIGIDNFSAKITDAWELANGLPGTFFIGKTGRIREDILGEENFKALSSRVKNLLGS